MGRAAISYPARWPAAPPERTSMNDTLIGTWYSTGLSRRNIEQALVAAGKDIDHSPARVSPADPQRLDIGGPQ